MYTSNVKSEPFTKLRARAHGLHVLAKKRGEPSEDFGQCRSTSRLEESLIWGRERLVPVDEVADRRLVEFKEKLFSKMVHRERDTKTCASQSAAEAEGPSVLYTGIHKKVQKV